MQDRDKEAKEQAEADRQAAAAAADIEEGEVLKEDVVVEPSAEEVETVRQALPPADGKALNENMLLYFHPATECTVPRIQTLFLDRRIQIIRSIGSGFASVTFGDSLECELARWQVRLLRCRTIVRGCFCLCGCRELSGCRLAR